MKPVDVHKALSGNRLRPSGLGGPRLDLHPPADASGYALRGRHHSELRFCLHAGRTDRRFAASGARGTPFLSELRMDRSARSRAAAFRYLPREGSIRRSRVQLSSLQGLRFCAGRGRRRVLQSLAVDPPVSAAASPVRRHLASLQALRPDRGSRERRGRGAPVRKIPEAGRQWVLLFDVRRVAGAGLRPAATGRSSEDGSCRKAIVGGLKPPSGTPTEPEVEHRIRERRVRGHDRCIRQAAEAPGVHSRYVVVELDCCVRAVR